MSAAPPAERPGQLIRGLSLVDSLSLVVGTIVGTGVLLKAAVMTQTLGSGSAVLLAWLAAGLLTLAGALTYAELGAMMPEAGGEYVFLRAAYGDAVAFLYGWVRFTAGSGSIAALGVSFATFLAPLAPLGHPWIAAHGLVWGHAVAWSFGPAQLVAIAPIAALAAINCAGVRAGGRLQVVLASIKVLAVLFIAGGVFLAARHGSWSHFTTHATTGSLTVSGVGTAMLGALWAYSGWSYLPMAAGEIRDPGRNIPRALIGGTLIVIALYLAINAAYFYALPPDAVAMANSTSHPAAPAIAALAADSFLTGGAASLVAAAFLIATLGTLNGGLLSNSRVPFAMTRARQFFPLFGHVGRVSHAPTWSITAFAVWAAILATTGTYDQLSDLAVFAFLIFFALTAAAVFVLRVRQPDAPRPYRTTGYPVVPFLYVVLTAWVIGNALVTSPAPAWTAIGFLALGVPVYLWFRAHRRPRRSPHRAQ